VILFEFDQFIKRVPEEWLKRYGALVDVLEFFFYDIGAGKIESLNGTKI